ncbi:MAG: hypothetical protein IPN17_31145 [Deltaproteobacteria bacterium]|nr:hypothetical protein [Deltaproteobacteria bacterium]
MSLRLPSTLFALLPLLASCGPSLRGGTVTDLTRVTVVAATPPADPAPLDVAVSSALRCPAPSRALAGTPVTLRADGSASGARVRWSVTAAPSDTRAYRFAAQYDDRRHRLGVVARGAEVPSPR